MQFYLFYQEIPSTPSAIPFGIFFILIAIISVISIGFTTTWTENNIVSVHIQRKLAFFTRNLYPFLASIYKKIIFAIRTG
ncbi:MAG: hypothetical protein ACTSV5_12355 [Promethearchaeota archaeon]